MSSIKKSSFQKKGISKSNLIKGTKPSFQNSLLLVSSGIPAVDALTGGGIPVGSLVLIIEDEFGSYATCLLKYFLAEGITTKHDTFLCSQDADPEEIIKQLPNPVDEDLDDENEVDKENEKEMTIAWRYENLKKVSSSPSSHVHFGHYFDLSKPISKTVLQKSSITTWHKSPDTTGESFKESPYWFLLTSIKEKLNKGHYFASDNEPEKNILRIALHKLNSPLWKNDSKSDMNQRNLLVFLYSLRCLIRNSYSTCMISLPFNDFNNDFMQKCIHLSDIAIQLQSFAGTSCENLQPYKDYHGFFIIQKISAINCLLPHNPGSANWVFKLRRKKLVIEEFHLPPEIEESTEREQDDSAVLTCSSASKSKLDF